MRIPTRFALTVPGLALAAGSVFAMGAATTSQAIASTTTSASQTVAAPGHGCGDWCDSWDSWGGDGCGGDGCWGDGGGDWGD